MLEILFIIAYTLITAYIAGLTGWLFGGYLIKKFHL